ncbi:NAD-dependent epimerase/dehydratase family protein [Streptomyces sp. NPDC093982]|uniref:NAD-dependent epimerase/dehydratase family protein n=1 Tax=Streptomyces sp. NPDC093982 TaxID=3155077 RepID=UPI003423AC0F
MTTTAPTPTTTQGHRGLPANLGELMAPLTRKEDLFDEIKDLVPAGSIEPRDPEVLARLTALTGQLISTYEYAGELDRHPFSDVADRTIHLYEGEVGEQLRESTVLVTGGEGYIGSKLITVAADFAPRRIVSVDIAGRRSDNPTERHLYRSDIADLDSLASIFAAERPDIVFHLAAEREPARAERQIRETIHSNIAGTDNVLQLCEEYRVKHCVYSSSGKAARYHTPDIYAGSKKITEWQLNQAAATGEVDYSAVRFTHVMENSIVHREMLDKIDRGIISFHSPDRYMHAQTKEEAVNLLLNSLAMKGAPDCQLSTVRDLGWPIDVLTIPLYEMKRRGVVVPLYFRGVPDGYESEFFRGQLDHSAVGEFNPMINAQETLFSRPDASEDMTIARVTPFSFRAFQRVLSDLKAAASVLPHDNVNIKSQLSSAIKEVSRTSFEETPLHRAWDILRWGVDARAVNIEDVLRDHRDTIELIARAVIPRLSSEQLKLTNTNRPKLVDVLQVLRRVENLDTEVAKLSRIAIK